MPIALQQVKRRLLQNMLQQFTSVFNSKINDLTLYAAVIKPITSFLQAEIHIAYSYSKTDYLFHYLSALNRLPVNTATPVMALISILVRMNCNSVTLKKYIIEKMKADLHNCGTDKLVRKKLESWQDFFRETPVRVNMVWNKNSISLKEEMLVGYLSNRNITEMMQELSGILHTTKQYNVSRQNLYNCYFTYDLATIKSLTEFFFVMTLHQLEVKLKKKGLNGKD
jgi:hypothetical protein